MDSRIEKLRRQLTLRLALVCYVILPLVVAIGLIVSLMLSTFEEQIETNMTEDVQLVARALQIPVARALQEGHEGALRNALESAMGINRVYGVYVYGTEGETMATAGAVNPMPDRGRLSTLAGEAAQGEYEEISGRNVYSYFLPLTSPGQRSMGLLQITRRERDIRASVAGLRSQVAGMSVIMVLVVAGLVLFGHREAIGRHLGALQSSMRRVEEGNVLHRAQPDGPKEIATLAGALNTMLDSIERAEHEIQVRRASQTDLKEKLRHAEKLAALGTLSAGVAHELGTPLSVIDGRAHRLLREESIGDEVRQTLNVIRKQVRRMDRIIRQLLDFGRSPVLQRRNVRAGFVVDAAVQAVKDHSRSRGVALEVRGANPSTLVDVDPVRIDQVLNNLLLNGIDAAHDVVRVSWSNTEQEFVLKVEDDGDGISEEVVSHIFEPFFTTKSVGDGTGLGLAVVHRIVEEHEGHIDVCESSLGGALFAVRLPIGRHSTVQSV